MNPHVEFKIMFFSEGIKFEGKGLLKTITQSIKYTRLVNGAVTYVSEYMRLEGVHVGRNVLSASKESCEDFGGDHQNLACQTSGRDQKESSCLR